MMTDQKYKKYQWYDYTSFDDLPVCGVIIIAHYDRHMNLFHIGFKSDEGVFYLYGNAYSAELSQRYLNRYSNELKFMIIDDPFK